jgi:hypothetical protein
VSKPSNIAEKPWPGCPTCGGLGHTRSGPDLTGPDLTGSEFAASRLTVDRKGKNSIAGGTVEFEPKQEEAGK